MYSLEIYIYIYYAKIVPYPTISQGVPYVDLPHNAIN
jgi:hypothetical protein